MRSPRLGEFAVPWEEDLCGTGPGTEWMCYMVGGPEEAGRGACGEAWPVGASPVPREPPVPASPPFNEGPGVNATCWQSSGPDWGWGALPT